MEKKRGEGKQILKREGWQAGSRGGCLKKGGAGTPLRTMDIQVCEKIKFMKG